MCDTTQSYVWHNSLIYATGLTSTVLQVSFLMLIWRNHVTHEFWKESYHTRFVCDMTPSNVRHDKFLCATGLAYTCDWTHIDSIVSIFPDAYLKESYHTRIFEGVMPHTNRLHTIRAWYDFFKCAKWCIPMCDMTHLYMQLDSHRHYCQYRSWCACAMTHSCLWHDSFICATWLIPVCDMTRVYVQHNSFSCAIWRIHMCKLRHFYVRQDFSCVQHDSFTCVTRVLLRRMIAIAGARALARARAHTHTHAHRAIAIVVIKELLDTPINTHTHP